MNTNNARGHRGWWLLLPWLVLGLSSCAGMNDELAEEPATQVAGFEQALSDLGKMSTVYGKQVLIQCDEVEDYTGYSERGYQELLTVLNQMTWQALGQIGGHVRYLPGAPLDDSDTWSENDANLMGKHVPDVVLVGTLAEYKEYLNADSFACTTAEEEQTVSGKNEETLRACNGAVTQSHLTQVTLGYQMVDFRTQADVARMQINNALSLFQESSRQRVGFILFWPNYGLKGMAANPQGRDTALRLLVQTSVIQIVGKYLHVPYWKLIPQMQPDQDVLVRIKNDYQTLQQVDKIAEVQTCLFLKGHDVPVDGHMNATTRKALRQEHPEFDPAQEVPDAAQYLALWTSLADDLRLVVDRRNQLARVLLEKKYNRRETVQRKMGSFRVNQVTALISR